jgi:hypothetical protein
MVTGALDRVSLILQSKLQRNLYITHNDITDPHIFLAPNDELPQSPFI